MPPLFDATWEPESGRAVGCAIASDLSVTAVFCGNDEIAMGVLRGLGEGGRSVPTDVSVVGFDDHPLSALWMPSITTARQDFVGLGRRGFGLLTRLLAGDASARFSNERPVIVVRESAAPPAARSALR